MSTEYMYLEFARNPIYWEVWFEGRSVRTQAEGSLEARREVYEREIATLERGSSSSDGLGAWIAESGATADEVHEWTLTTFGPDGAEEVHVERFGSDWANGAPLGAIATSLNRCTADGWTVVSTSEDKALYPKAPSHEAYPARIRFLLGRDRSP